MADNLYDTEKHTAKLYAWGLWAMLRGAGWGLLVFLALIAVAYVLLGVRALLPVNPNAMLEPLAVLAALA
jgi:hypothetical protein